MEEDLRRLHQASSQQEVIDSFRSLGRSVVDLADRTGRRQMDLKDPRRRDDLASARAVLKKNSLMLLTTSKVSVTSYITDERLHFFQLALLGLLHIKLHLHLVFLNNNYNCLCC